MKKSERATAERPMSKVKTCWGGRGMRTAVKHILKSTRKQKVILMETDGLTGAKKHISLDSTKDTAARATSKTFLIRLYATDRQANPRVTATATCASERQQPPHNIKIKATQSATHAKNDSLGTSLSSICHSAQRHVSIQGGAPPAVLLA